MMREFIYARKDLQGFILSTCLKIKYQVKKVIFVEHKKSLNWGVAMTVIIVLDTTFLRCLSKSVIRKRYGCKKFRSLPYHSPQPGPLPKDRTKKCLQLEVIGTDYAGPIYYKTKRKSKLKVYILLFPCSVNRAVLRELVPYLTSAEFKNSFKRLTSRRGKPKIVYSETVYSEMPKRSRKKSK